MPRSIVLALAALLGACTSDLPVAPGDGPLSLARFRTQATAYTDESLVDAPEVGIVRGQHEWDGLYGRVMGRVVPAPTTGPRLAFGDSSVVYVAAGYFPNASADIMLDSAGVVSGVLVVHYTKRTLSGCGVAAVTIAPVDMGQIPRWAGSVRFVQHDSVEVCG
ncbi:MAG: hypothetical protein JF590_03225 [Gemmatimonadetes bacterium]|nr:hypothetical protein [Gemmatimonadota bacterium]